MKIKQLVWTETEDGVVAEVPTIDRRYVISQEGKFWFPLWDSNLPGCRTLEETKALAQRDFEDIIEEFLEES